jgi:iron complex transport system substrate-binding protein
MQTTKIPTEMRIVSLLPSATEILCLLGLQDRLAGVSHECDYPPGIELPRKVTRTRLQPTMDSRELDSQVKDFALQGASLYELDREALIAIQPDLIVTQSVCSVCAVSERDLLEVSHLLPKPAEVVTLNPSNLDEVIACISQVGKAAGVEARAAEVVTELKLRIDAVSKRSRSLGERPSVLMLEWIDPLYSAGHWNPELVWLAGGREVLGQAGSRSRKLDWDEVLSADPDLLVIACCGLSIDRTLEDLPRLVSYRNFAQLKCIGNGQVYLVDGSQYFNRPGPRLVDSLELLAHTLHPELHPLPPGLEAAVRMKREPRGGKG